jgi:hypothetical protein
MANALPRRKSVRVCSFDVFDAKFVYVGVRCKSRPSQKW